MIESNKMKKNVVKIIKQPQSQGNHLHVDVNQSEISLPPCSKTILAGIHKATIENLHQSKEITIPVVLLRNKTVFLLTPPSSRKLTLYHWSDSSSFPYCGTSFSVTNEKTVFICVVDEKTKTRSPIEAIELTKLSKDKVFFPQSTFSKIKMNSSLNGPTISKTGTLISITKAANSNTSLIAWTTNPKEGYNFTSADIPLEADIVFSIVIDLNSFTKSPINKLELKALIAPTIATDNIKSTYTIDSGTPYATLSIRGDITENINTQKDSLIIPCSCITRKAGLRFYATQHGARQSASIIANGVILTQLNEFILNDGDYIVVNDFNCYREDHSIIPARFRVPFFHDGQLKEVAIPAFVCSDCSKVFVFEPNLWDIPQDYEYTRRFIRPNGKVVKGPPVRLSGIMEAESPLKKSGYTTEKGGPSDITRRQILKRMIDLRVLGSKSKERICSYLQFFVKNNYNKNSISIWKDDLELISNYDGNPNLDYLNSN